MNVIILNDSAYIRGGADRVAFDSACGLATAGCSVVLFAGFGPVAESLQSVPNLTVHLIGTSWLRNEQSSVRGALRGLWNAHAARQLRELLRRYDRRETIVHAHLYSSALTASVLHASIEAGFATVLTLHDYFITCPNGAYFVFPRAEPCERRALTAGCLACHCDSRKRVHKIWRVARTWLQTRVALLPRRLAGYVAVSQACALLARRDLPAPATIRVIPNIVSAQPGLRVAAERNHAFVFAGRLESYKGPHLLAAAAAHLDAPVVFCGEGPLKEELKQLNPRARFTGWLSSEALNEELGRARAFVFPSIYRETFGLSAAEALARGVPVVASRGTAAEEFVQHRRNGLLFERNSVSDLIVQLRALEDSTTVRRLSGNAYDDYWAAPLTLESHLAQLIEFYNALLPGSNQQKSEMVRASVNV